MPDETTPDGVPVAVNPDTAEAPAPDSSASIRPGMSEQEIRDAGLAIDVPFESGEPQPSRLRYADLGMPWTPPDGWPPETGKPQDADGANGA